MHGQHLPLFHCPSPPLQIQGLEKRSHSKLHCTCQTSKLFQNVIMRAAQDTVWTCNPLGEVKDASSSLSTLSCFSGTSWNKTTNSSWGAKNIDFFSRHNYMSDAVLLSLLRCGERWAPPQSVRQLIRCTSHGLKQKKNKLSANKEKIGHKSRFDWCFSFKRTFSKPGEAAALARTRLAQNTGLECELREWRWSQIHGLMEQVPQSHHHVSQSVIVARRHFSLPCFLWPRPLTYHVLTHRGQRSDESRPFVQSFTSENLSVWVRLNPAQTTVLKCMVHF